MNQKGTLLALTVLIVGAALLLALRAHQFAGDAERARMRMAASRQRLIAVLPAASGQPWAGELVRADLERVLADVRRMEADAAIVRTGKEKDDGTFGLTHVMKDPKLQSVYFRFVRAENALKLGPFFHEQGLTEEQVGKILDARVKFQETDQDLLATKLAQEPDAALDPGVLELMKIQEGTRGAYSAAKYFAARDEAVAVLYEKARAELEEAQKEVLGPEGFERLQHYELTIPVRDGVQRFAGAATMLGIPLTVGQTEQLTLAIANTSPEFRSGFHRMELGTIDWTQAEERAKEILSAEQMKLFAGTDLIRLGDFKPQLRRAIWDAFVAMPVGK